MTIKSDLDLVMQCDLQISQNQVVSTGPFGGYVWIMTNEKESKYFEYTLDELEKLCPDLFWQQVLFGHTVEEMYYRAFS